MNIHEFQAKELLRRYGVPVPAGKVAVTPAEAKQATAELGGRAVVKAQIHAGGRGKAGGVKLAATPDEAQSKAQEMLGKKLVTHQTGPEGREVRRVLSPQGGVFLYVTYRQPHFVMPLLSCEGTNWDIEAEHLGAGDGSFGYYAFVCRPRSRTGEDQEVAGRADEEA